MPTQVLGHQIEFSSDPRWYSPCCVGIYQYRGHYSGPVAIRGDLGVREYYAPFASPIAWLGSIIADGFLCSWLISLPENSLSPFETVAIVYGALLLTFVAGNCVWKSHNQERAIRDFTGIAQARVSELEAHQTQQQNEFFETVRTEIQEDAQAAARINRRVSEQFFQRVARTLTQASGTGEDGEGKEAEAADPEGSLTENLLSGATFSAN